MAHEAAGERHGGVGPCHGVVPHGGGRGDERPCHGVSARLPRLSVIDHGDAPVGEQRPAVGVVKTEGHRRGTADVHAVRRARRGDGQLLLQRVVVAREPQDAVLHALLLAARGLHHVDAHHGRRHRTVGAAAHIVGRGDERPERGRVLLPHSCTLAVASSFIAMPYPPSLSSCHGGYIDGRPGLHPDENGLRDGEGGAFHLV